MAIYLATDTPTALHSAFDKAIDNKSITTWERDSDGDYTHKAANWTKKLWLRPSQENGRLAFYTVPPKDTKIQRVDYAYYHGHLIETFINHFPSNFSIASATPNAAGSDNIG
jgi:hypothetical protein